MLRLKIIYTYFYSAKPLVRVSCNFAWRLGSLVRFSSVHSVRSLRPKWSDDGHLEKEQLIGPVKEKNCVKLRLFSYPSV